MRLPRYTPTMFVVLCLLTRFSSTAHTQDLAQPANETAQLVALLASDAGTYDKAMACRRLAIVGDRSAVPSLASLLADPKMATYARTALEAIPDSEAATALRGATAQLQGELLAGVLGSIGKRRDEKAVPAMQDLLEHDDSTVATAAASALGHIGNAQAATVLQNALSDIAANRRPAVGSACVLCAQRLAEQGERAKAVALLDMVAAADVPAHIQRAAEYRAILVLGKDGSARLIAQLTSDHEWRFRLALQAARQLGPGASVTLAAQLSKLTKSRQAKLIIALGDLGNKTALPAIIEAANRGTKEVRIEAIVALGKLGDSKGVVTLLDASTDSDDDVATAARSALAVLDSDDINVAIVGMLDSEDVNARRVAVTLAGQRGITAATPVLFRLADDPKAAMRLAAVESLGSTIRLEDLPKLIAMATDSKTAEHQKVARDALRTASARLPREACAGRLVDAMKNSSTAARVHLLEQLTAVGGTAALNAVAAAAAGSDDTMQDAATRLLGEWPTADAAPALLDLAKTLGSKKYKIRALRGYVRIARQLSMTADERMTVCRNTLRIAERSEEKVLIFEVLRRYPTPEGLVLAVSLVDDKNLAQPACATIVSMAGVVALKAPEPTEKALLRVIELTANESLEQEAQRQLATARELVRQHREESQFTPLFDGSSLDDWQCTPGVFRIEDGAIVGGSLEEPIGTGNDFACTKRQYGDFELRLQFKLLGNNANGGVNLRSKRIPTSGVAAGYQADLGQGYWGSLYDEARRNRTLAQANPKPPIRPGEWNDYRILCEGRRIRLWVNGVQTVDYTEQDQSIPTTGIIALQVQAGRPSEAWYRNVRIKVR